MNRRKIGGTSVEVGDLGFGAAQIGNLYTEVDDETAAQAVDAAWTAGLRYFDTAPHYGLGLSEWRLGAALAAEISGGVRGVHQSGTAPRAQPVAGRLRPGGRRLRRPRYVDAFL